MADVALLGVEVSRAVQALDEIALLAIPLKLVDGHLSHAGHDPHVGHHVGTVGDLDADLRHGTPRGAHQVGDHVHRPTGHTAVVQRIDHGVHLGRCHPVVGRARLVLGRRTDECPILDPRHVVDVAAGVVRPGVLVPVKTHQRAVVDHHVVQQTNLLVTAIAPMDTVGSGLGGDLIDPLL